MIEKMISQKIPNAQIIRINRTLHETHLNIFFENGYGASLIRGEFTYGGKEGLYEIAIVKGNSEHSEISYDNPITEDVLGYLTHTEVIKYLLEIQAL